MNENKSRDLVIVSGSSLLLAPVAAAATALIHLIAVVIENSESNDIAVVLGYLHLGCVGGIAGFFVSLPSLCWRSILQCLVLGGVAGTLGYAVIYALMPSLWYFAFFPPWIAEWTALGIMASVVYGYGLIRGVVSGLIAGLLSSFPLFFVLPMWLEPGPPPFLYGEFFGWWWVTFFVGFIVLAIFRPQQVPER